MRRGPEPGKTFDVVDEVVTIGSGSKNTLVIRHADVSREHCRLVRIQGDYELQDLGSQRGTYVSGQRLNHGWMLRSGNLIELGEYVTLEYSRTGETANLQPARATDAPPPEQPPYMVVVAGINTGQTFPLLKARMRLGRDPQADLHIPETAISRIHLELRWEGTTFTVVDLGSTNGSKLNGVPLQPHQPQTLHADDILGLADTLELRYTWQPEDVKREVVLKQGPTSGMLNRAALETTHIETNKIFEPGGKRKTPLGTGLLTGALVDHIFIAYDRAEWTGVVAPMIAHLQDSAINVWVDQYLAQGGDDWTAAVEQALAECWLLVVVMTPEALEARHVKLAYRYFFNRERPIIPLRLRGGGEMPAELLNRPSIAYDSASTVDTFDALVLEIKRLMRLR